MGVGQVKFDAINLDGEHGVWSAVEVDQHVALSNALGMSVYVSPPPPRRWPSAGLACAPLPAEGEPPPRPPTRPVLPPVPAE